MFGCSTQEMVALSGAHTIGNKGFGNPNLFDNSYFQILLQKPWKIGGMQLCTQSPWFHQVVLWTLCWLGLSYALVTGISMDYVFRARRWDDIYDRISHRSCACWRRGVPGVSFDKYLLLLMSYCSLNIKSISSVGPTMLKELSACKSSQSITWTLASLDCVLYCFIVCMILMVRRC